MRTRYFFLPLLLITLACNPTTFPTPAEPASGAMAAPAAASSPAIAPAAGATYYVRPDGGNAEQCTGLADAPCPGSGSGQPFLERGRL